MSNIADSLDNVGESLGRKVGPLPAWAWASMAVAGVTAAIVIRRRFARGTVGEPAEPGADGDPGDVLTELVGTSAPGVPGGFVIGGGPTQATGSTGEPEPPSAPERPRTNSDWMIEAQRFLIGRGYQGTIVTDALARFLSGRVLTPQGSAIIDAAIGGIGAPPQPVPPPTVSPTPEPVPSPGGGGTAPAPRPAPAPAPAPAARTVASKKVYRWNGGPDGPGGFFSAVLWRYTDGTTQLQWIPDGNTYLALASGGVTTLDLAGFQNLMASHPHERTPRPPWTPPGTAW